MVNYVRAEKIYATTCWLKHILRRHFRYCGSGVRIKFVFMAKCENNSFLHFRLLFSATCSTSSSASFPVRFGFYCSTDHGHCGHTCTQKPNRRHHHRPTPLRRVCFCPGEEFNFSFESLYRRCIVIALSHLT